LLFRLIILVVLIFLLLALLKGYLARTRVASRRRPPPIEGEDMALDPQCQSYVPKREAIEEGGNYFCSRECADGFLTNQRK
jgi:YHS domain-containing protein